MGLKNFFEKNKMEVGCDEAGRGCLAGPVYAAAVILDPHKKNSQLNDSKKITKKQRDELRSWIEKNSLAWAVGIVDQSTIDEINILNASFLAMHRAIDQLDCSFDHLLIDGNRFKPYRDFPFHCIVKGDGKYKSIAAASILAKTHRDEYMQQIANEFPQYDWKNNQGYPTQKHREAIKVYGKCIPHRSSFRLLPEQMKLDFS